MLFNNAEQLKIQTEEHTKIYKDVTWKIFQNQPVKIVEQRGSNATYSFICKTEDQFNGWIKEHFAKEIKSHNSWMESAKLGYCDGSIFFTTKEKKEVAEKLKTPESMFDYIMSFKRYPDFSVQFVECNEEEKQKATKYQDYSL